MAPRETHPTAQPSDPIIETDPRVHGLAEALAVLGRHARAMNSAEELLHADCYWCETMKLFSRVADFGKQLRQAERNPGT